MSYLRIAYALLASVCAALLVAYAGADDSPGAQLLGLMLGLGALACIVLEFRGR